VIFNVVVKVASRCNLNCSYCYLYNHEDASALRQPKQISDRVFSVLLDRMRTHADRHDRPMSITLHGGEPTLIGTDRMRHLVGLARKCLGSRLSGVSIQTNATLIDAQWAGLFAELEMTVGVSMDGPAEIHDRVRVTHGGNGSHAAVVEGIEALRAAGIPIRILCVVDPGGDGLLAYRHFRSLGVRHLDFLLPDVSHDNRVARYGSAAHPVADYLLPVLDAWLEENDPGVFIPLFWDLLARGMGAGTLHTDCFGNPPMTYAVVNTDGSIEPLDALKVCDDGITSTEFNVLTHEFDDIYQRPSLFADALAGDIALPADCRGCRHMAVCGGGYLPHRYRRDTGFDNPSVWCVDIQLLLDRMGKLLATTAPLQAVAATGCP